MPEIFVWIAVLFWEDLVAGWGSPCRKSLCGEPHAVADPFHSNCVAIVVVVHSTLEDWAKKSGIKYSTFAELCEWPESNKEVLSSLSQISISTSCESSCHLIPVWNCLVNCVPWLCLYLLSIATMHLYHLLESVLASVHQCWREEKWLKHLSISESLYILCRVPCGSMKRDEPHVSICLHSGSNMCCEFGEEFCTTWSWYICVLGCHFWRILPHRVCPCYWFYLMLWHIKEMEPIL
jgi:hypothetical protein